MVQTFLPNSITRSAGDPNKAINDRRYRSWAGWLHAELLACAQPLIREGHLPPHFMRLAEDVLRSLAPQLENVRPALVHGDLGDQEIFVDARSVRRQSF